MADDITVPMNSSEAISPHLSRLNLVGNFDKT
jgi:hypothetical protein